MYDDFRQKNKQCSYETYRKAIKALNISFTKLGEEECELCLKHDIHIKAVHQADTAGCDVCQQWEVHQHRAVKARDHYRLDAERGEVVDTVVRSVDQKKVIMLPRMPGVKAAVFMRRISAFHEAFASVGKKSLWGAWCISCKGELWRGLGRAAPGESDWHTCVPLKLITLSLFNAVACWTCEDWTQTHGWPTEPELGPRRR